MTKFKVIFVTPERETILGYLSLIVVTLTKFHYLKSFHYDALQNKDFMTHLVAVYFVKLIDFYRINENTRLTTFFVEIISFQKE